MSAGEVVQQDRPRLRRDAQRNAEKLSATAVEVFHERGLDAPLEEIARRAGVSTGTLYNRFGSRAGLIDAVLPDLVATRLAAVVDRVSTATGAWHRFATFVVGICELQASDPAMSDALSRRYPDARALSAVCDAHLEQAEHFVQQAQAEGSLRADLTLEDLLLVFAANAALRRATTGIAPRAWQRSIALQLDGLRTPAAHPLPVVSLTRDEVRRVLLEPSDPQRRRT